MAIVYIINLDEGAEIYMMEEGWIPSRLKTRPTFRGLPIPVTVFIDPKTGEPDFRVLVKEKTEDIARRKLCGLCGQALMAKAYFIGGDLCKTNRLFNDAPMHRECCFYAAITCPYIALPNKNYKDKQGDAERFGFAKGEGAKKPEMYMFETSGFKLVTGHFPPSGMKQTLIKASPYIRVIPVKDILRLTDEFRDGKEFEEITREEAPKPTAKPITANDILGRTK